MAVIVFALVVIIAGFTFFALASYETRNALYREDSSEAFYLADAALERMRAHFLDNRAWRQGYSGVPLGRGTYDLAVVDSTFPGETDVVWALATGHVGVADRSIELFAKVPATAFQVGILVLGDANVGGNLCLLGDAHVVGMADFGPHDSHLACGGAYTSGFTITPPPVYTEPAYYPNTTYYYVIGNMISGTPQARILDANGVDITSFKQDSLTTVTSYNNGQNLFTFDFSGTATVDHYFNDSTGVFNRNTGVGDVAVVVNFGQVSLTSPVSTAAVVIDGGSTSDVHSTIINTRFTGVTTAQRSDTNYWTGGLTTIKQIVMEPYQGIALIVHDLQKQGGSLSQVGTTTWPAFVYVTRDVVAVNSNFNLVGGIACLRNWNSTGGPSIQFDAGFLQNFPAYLYQSWTGGVSGSLKVLRWREVASSGP